MLLRPRRHHPPLPPPLFRLPQVRQSETQEIEEVCVSWENKDQEEKKQLLGTEEEKTVMKESTGSGDFLSWKFRLLKKAELSKKLNFRIS